MGKSFCEKRGGPDRGKPYPLDIPRASDPPTNSYERVKIPLLIRDSNLGDRGKNLFYNPQQYATIM
jgi:hypothetical protein